MIESRTAKVLILSSGQALTALVGIASSAILTRLFSQTEFGTYRQAMLSISFAVPFVMLGLNRVLFVFLPREENRPRGVLIENLVLLTAAGLILASVISLGGGHLLAKRFNNPALEPLLTWFSFYACLTMSSAGVSGCLIACGQATRLAVFNVTSRVISFLLVVVLTWFWRTPASALLGLLLGAAGTCTVGIWLMLAACPGAACLPSLSGIGRQLTFAIPLGLASLFGSLSMSLDQMIVSLRCTTEQFAVYTVGAMEIPLIGVITGSITSVVIVDYARYYREGKLDEVVRLIQLAMSRSAVLLFPVMMYLLIIAPSLMRILYGIGYEEAALPFRIYLLLLPVRTLTFGAVIQATGDSRPILVQSFLGLASNALVGWLLAGWWGPPGAAAASLAVTYLVSVPYLAFIIQRRLKIPITSLFPLRVLARVIFSSLLAASVAALPLRALALADFPNIVFATTLFVPVVGFALLKTGAVDWSMLHSVIFRTTLRRETG